MYNNSNNNNTNKYNENLQYVIACEMILLPAADRSKIAYDTTTWHLLIRYHKHGQSIGRRGNKMSTISTIV